MPEYLAPGVYVEEIPARPKPIEGVSTSIAGFVGPTYAGPADAVVGPITCLAEFVDRFGEAGSLSFSDTTPLPFFLWHAARAFFREGGKRLHVVRARRESGKQDSYPRGEDYGRALAALEDVDEVAMIAAPGHTYAAAGVPADAAAVSAALVAAVERRRDRMAILDSPDGQTVDQVRAWRTNFESPFAALYFPWIRTTDDSGKEILLPPSGFVAGIHARTDAERGVHKGAGGQALRSARGVEVKISDVVQRSLNPEHINVIRQFPDRGVVVWGNRTLSTDTEWKYVNVRRYFTYLERSIYAGMQWVAFEPNDEPLWREVRGRIGDFLFAEWRRGALQGRKPEEAYFAKCDRATMTQDDLDNGRLICLIGIAPRKPAEFVIFRIGLWTSDKDC
jgi:phage tail sheath protein FI